MTVAETARKSVVSQGRAIALTIVPLALLAASASTQLKAVSLSFGNGTCTLAVNNNGSLPTQSQTICITSSYTPVSGLQNGANSITAYTNGSGDVVSSSSGGPVSVEMDDHGPANDFDYDGSLPVNWVFDVTSVSGLNNAQYAVSFIFANGEQQVGSYTTTLTPLSFSGGTASISGSNLVAIDGAVTSWDMSIEVNGTFAAGGGSFTLQVPNENNGAPASLDLNEVQGTPEPASLALGATGLGALLLSRFRRRKI